MNQRDMKETDLLVREFMKDHFKSELNKHFTFFCNWQIVKLSNLMVCCSEMFKKEQPVKNKLEDFAFQNNTPIFTDDASELFICYLRMNKIDQKYHLSLFAKYEQIMEDSIFPTTKYIAQLLGE